MFGNGGVRLGKIIGIELRVDFSWFFIFVLMTWNLSVVFSSWHPGWALPQSFALAVIASLLFFASVVAHELAHSLVAKANGIDVRSITLFLFGGVSSFEREPTSPRVEFWSAIVGPVTSFVLGVIFLLLGSWRAAPIATALTDPRLILPRLGPGATLLLWLGPVNIFVGLFNLIPGFPLDGGRVLRALLWTITRDLRRATRMAAGAGHAIAWALIVAGVAMAFGVRVPYFGTGLAGGLWLAFIGWFLNTAASQSYQQLVVRGLLEGVHVAQVMRTRGAAVRSDLSIASLVEDWIMTTDERAFPVVDGDTLVGMICMEDVRRVPRDRWPSVTVGSAMTPAERLVIASPHEDLEGALRKMAERDVSQLPVVEQGRLIGVLRRRDIGRWLELQSNPDRARWIGPSNARPRV